MLERLREINKTAIYDVRDPHFKTYGRVITGYDFTPFVRYVEQHTPIPEEGNVYAASLPELEELGAAKALGDLFYGGMPVQIGYCNGRNTTYNGFEYHKGSEINVAVTDFMLVLGHVWDIKDDTYHVETAEVFFVERGTAIEMYQTTLHLSPCRVCDEGFRDVVILPKGTNTPLAREDYPLPDGEARLLLQRNKWVIAHPERTALIRQGAYPGLMGENRELLY